MIRLKCKDGKELRIIRQSKIFTGGFNTTELNAIESLSNSNDALKKEYYGTGQKSFGTKEIDCCGINVVKMYQETMGYKYQITDNIELVFLPIYNNSSVNWSLQIFFKYKGNEFLSTKYVCQKMKNEKLYYDHWTAELKYNNYPRVLICSQSDDITNISNIQILIMNQNTGGYGFSDFAYLPTYNIDYATGSSQEKKFFDELRGVATISEPISDSIPDVNGDYDNSSDDVGIADINNINLSSAIQSGLVKCYAMSAESINSLSDFLWSDSFINVIKKLQNDPIQNIQKLCYYPFEVEKGSEANIWIGNADSGISAPRVVKQFQEIDFGELQITEYYGNSLDYETDISIFLPFIGEKTLSCVDIMGGTINLKYRVDILTGTCVAIISAVRVQNAVTLKSVLYTFSGDMSNEVPLTASQNNFLKSLVSNPTDVEKTLTPAATCGGLSMIGGMSHSYSHTGSIGGNVGFLSVLTPYLIIRRPVNVKPSNYEKTFGYPAYTSDTLANQKGYCRYKECYYDNKYLDLEKDVADEILNKLKTKGVYIK